jgi:hypothetical protein
LRHNLHSIIPDRNRKHRRSALLRLIALCSVAALIGLGGARARRATAATSLPARWPSTLQLGLADSPGGAAVMRATAPFGFRYQYLSGGVNTGGGWATWNSGGAFATYYIQDSIANGIVPVFSYYQILQSTPGNNLGEPQGVLANFKNTSTMAAYYQDLTLFFQKAAAFPSNLVVLQVEPDAWGYLEQASTNNAAASVPIQVAASGNADLTGLSNTAAGFSQAVKKLRDKYAPNVALVSADAQKAAAFYQSLGASFDLTFAEASDRDADFKQYVYGDGGASWWGPADYQRNVLFLQTYHAAVPLGIVEWQLPLGNTRMRAENNTWDHYQDNHVETLLGDLSRSQLTNYRDAGVVAFLFGRGADGPTCACDAAGDGVTNPAPINGNTLTSLSADDDGGYFRQQAKQYYQTGAMPLAGGGPPPTGSSPTITSAGSATFTVGQAGSFAIRTTGFPAPTVSVGGTLPQGIAFNSGTGALSGTPASGSAGSYPLTVTASNGVSHAASQRLTLTVAASTKATFTTSAGVGSSTVAAGSNQEITVTVTSTAATTALVDVEVYNAAGQKVFQQYWDNQGFAAGTARSFGTSWTVPASTAAGTYTVKVGIFSPGWGTLLGWNNSAATFAVR